MGGLHKFHILLIPLPGSTVGEYMAWLFAIEAFAVFPELCFLIVGESFDG
jgi:hypothetical protein